MNLSDIKNIKFKGECINPDYSSIEVVGDLVRKCSRFGGQNHYIYVDNDNLEEDGIYYLVEFSSIEIIIEK